MVDLWFNAMQGVEFTKQSAVGFTDYSRREMALSGPAPTFRTETTINGSRKLSCSQSIAKGIARLGGKQQHPPVLTHCFNREPPVARACRHYEGTNVAGRKCILSILSTMYQELNISPPQLRALQEVANNTILENHSKFIMCHDRPWWRDGGYNGYFLSYAGPISLARDASVNEQRNYQPACSVNGQSGREWSKLPPHERRPQAMQQIVKMFNVGANHKAFRPIEMFH